MSRWRQGRCRAPAPANGRLLADAIVRLGGLWLLAGGVLKAVAGTPQDLPQALRTLPVPSAGAWIFVLALECGAGVMGLIHPRRGWMATCGVLAVISAVAGSLVLDGRSACRCMGGALALTPTSVLLVDLALLAAALSARAAGCGWGRRRGVATGLGLAAFVAALAFLLHDPSRTPSLPGVRLLDAERAEWVGRTLSDTSLAQWLPAGSIPDTGLVIVALVQEEGYAALVAHARGRDRVHLPALLIEVPAAVTDASRLEGRPRQMNGADLRRAHAQLGTLLTLPVILELADRRIRSVR